MNRNLKPTTFTHLLLVFVILSFSNIAFGLDQEQDNESINKEAHSTILGLLTCSMKPDEITGQKDQIIQDYINDNFNKRERENYFKPKHEVEFLGIKVINVFPGSLGTLPAFAFQLDADVKTVLSAIPNESIEKKQCIDKGCQYKLSKDKTFILSSASLWFGESHKNTKTTIFGCMYSYKR